MVSVALPGVRVTFSAADQQEDLTSVEQKREKTVKSGSSYCNLNYFDLKVVLFIK